MASESRACAQAVLGHLQANGRFGAIGSGPMGGIVSRRGAKVGTVFAVGVDRRASRIVHFDALLHVIVVWGNNKLVFA